MRKHLYIYWGRIVIKIAIFASGSGSNFENIVNRVQKDLPGIEVTALYTDKAGVKCIERAEN